MHHVQYAPHNRSPFAPYQTTHRRVFHTHLVMFLNDSNVCIAPFFFIQTFHRVCPRFIMDRRSRTRPTLVRGLSLCWCQATHAAHSRLSSLRREYNIQLLSCLFSLFLATVNERARYVSCYLAFCFLCYEDDEISRPYFFPVSNLNGENVYKETILPLSPYNAPLTTITPSVSKGPFRYDRQ